MGSSGTALETLIDVPFVVSLVGGILAVTAVVTGIGIAVRNRSSSYAATGKQAAILIIGGIIAIGAIPLMYPLLQIGTGVVQSAINQQSQVQQVDPPAQQRGR